MLRLSDGDFDLLRELERGARPGPSAYRLTDEDYEAWLDEFGMALPPITDQEEPRWLSTEKSQGGPATESAATEPSGPDGGPDDPPE